MIDKYCFYSYFCTVFQHIDIHKNFLYIVTLLKTNKMKKILISMIAFAMMLPMGCDKIKDATSHDYTITNLTIKAEGVSGQLVIPSYTMGGTFIAPSNMNAFTSAFIMKLLDREKIDVTVTGQSDAPAGTTLYIKYQNDIMCTAGLF